MNANTVKIYAWKSNIDICSNLSLEWRHNGHDGVSNYQPHKCLFNRADQRKHQSSESLAFVQGIHRGPVNSPHKWQVTRKLFPFDDVIMHCIRPTTHVVSSATTWLIFSKHDDVMMWKRFPHYWLFAGVICRLPVDFPHKGTLKGGFDLCFLCWEPNKL